MGLRIWSFIGAALIIFSGISAIPGNSTARAQTGFTISGRVTEPPSGTGVGISEVTVTLTVNSSTQTMTQTDSNGNFSFPNIPAGSDYDVRPSKPSYTFSPTSQGGTNLQGNRELFFTGAASASSTVQFSAAAFSFTETSTSLSITVTRTGDISGIASVSYATSDTASANNCNVVNGAASSRCDYITAIGTLRFAGGESSKNILIPIIDDVYVEGSETFTITLSNATGATLGSPSTATITINESETGGANPIDQAGFFVRQHYIDFLNREPDAAGLNFWTGEIDGCTPKPQCIEIKRINVSAAFFLSIEFQETGYLVYRMYKSAYGDTTSPNVAIPVPIIRLLEFLPDAQSIGHGVQVGVGDWQTQLENNKSALAAEFVSRSRFTSRFPTTMTSDDFVSALYANAEVTPSADERAATISAFGSGDTAGRARALRHVAENSRLAQQEFNKAFVLMQYYGYLRRNPDDPQDTDFSGWEFWLGKLNQFNGNFVNAQMVKAFLDSIEYRQRFAP